jgi:hypothetical protein
VKRKPLRCNVLTLRLQLLLPRINLIAHSNWNYLILSQKPKSHISEMDPWIADVRKITNTTYLLRYFDRKQKIEFRPITSMT